MDWKRQANFEDHGLIVCNHCGRLVAYGSEHYYGGSEPGWACKEGKPPEPSIPEPPYRSVVLDNRNTAWQRGISLWGSVGGDPAHWLGLLTREPRIIWTPEEAAKVGTG